MHAVALFAARYVPALLPYHAWFMWTFVHQPGPVRWGEFARGLWSRVSGRGGEEGPWPRVEELEGFAEEKRREEERAAAVAEEEERAASPAPSSSGSTTLNGDAPADPDHKKEDHLSVPFSAPSDLLTPPYTPPTLSPKEGVSPTRTTTRQRSASRLSLPAPAFVAIDGVVAASLDEEALDVDAPAEKVRAGGRLPWPILEDEPTYRVDESVKVFNYDCGLCVLLPPSRVLPQVVDSVD